MLSLSAGCFPHTVPIQDLEERAALEVHLDANARAFAPGREIKFFVDLMNRTSSRIDLKNLRVELLVSPEKAPETVSLRQPWSYRWGRDVYLEGGKKITLPIVPEKGLELRLDLLSPGSYSIVALVNGRFTSGPYPLRIVRPDLETWRPSTRPGPSS
jgi:hypothetical protein